MSKHIMHCAAVVLVEYLTLLPWLQFLRKMAQPYDKTGGSGKKTLLSQEDLEKMGNGNNGELLF